MALTSRSSLNELTRRFATDIIAAIKEALDNAEQSRPRRGRPPGSGRRRRRGAIDVVAEGKRILAGLRRYPGGVRSEELRRETGIDKVPFVRAMGRLLADKQITKTGERRRTTYFPSGAKRAAAAKSSRKPSKAARKPRRATR
jgi:hypothetical protein